MTTSFQIFCGTDTNGRNVDAKKIALDLALKYFPDGHSIREETGRWAIRDHFGPTSEIVTESTIIISWFATDQEIATGSAESLVNRLAADFKAQAFQQSVLITRQNLDASFV